MVDVWGAVQTIAIFVLAFVLGVLILYAAAVVVVSIG
jgi:hypothetical protein